MSENKVTIRPFEAKDLFESSELTNVLKALTDVGEIAPEERKAIAETLAHDPYYIFVAEIEGKIVGTATLFAEQKIIHGGKKCGHIEDVSVGADFQGKGIGGKLIAALLEKAQELGCYKAILDCDEKLSGFYGHAGFKVAGISMRRDL